MVGVTCGSFDYYIHDGHMMFLNSCRQICDLLYVAIVADETIVKNKNRQPYFTQKIRAKNLLETSLVNDVIYLHCDGDCLQLLQCQPDIYILGKDQYDNSWTRQAVDTLYCGGIRIVSTFEVRINSTTRLLKKVGYL